MSTATHRSKAMWLAAVAAIALLLSPGMSVGALSEGSLRDRGLPSGGQLGTLSERNGGLTGLSAAPLPAARFCNANPINIPSAGMASPYPSGIKVEGLGGTVSQVVVDLYDLGHDFYGDMDMLLVGPKGQNVVLMSDSCDSCPRQHVNLTFADGAQPLPLTSCPVSGSIYRPTNNTFGLGGPDNFPPPAPQAGTPYGEKLSNFNGTSPNGTWSLYVVDDWGAFTGHITGGWCLNISTSAAKP